MGKFTLKDRLVQESLKTLSDLNSHIVDLDIVIVGGIACQAYSISPDFYRPTNDIDSLTSRQVSPKEFREDLGKNISDYLIKAGYITSLGKTRYGYEIRSQEDGEDFFIHISKFSNAYLKRHKEWKQREIENAKKITIPEVKNYPVLVHRIEDILANKARRIGRLKQQGYVSDEKLEEWQRFLEEDFEGLGSVDLIKKLERVEQTRNNLLDINQENFSKNIHKLNMYKTQKDLYDIALLSRTIIEGKETLNIQYLRNALTTVPTTK